ncbi:N-acetyltransferase family protein [Myxococcota bacterium]|nr:N-acetyltransferase family protein [Myxococcota bacterium]
METSRIRVATEADAAAIAAIYAPHVIGSHTSFEAEAPSADVMAERIRTTLRTHPWLVEVDARGDVAGYAYASLHRARAAYQWSCEVSVYVAGDHHRGGVGRRLYGRLFDVLVRQGFYNAYAGITLPNAPSVAFHTSMGFEPIGIYRNIGFKLGAWRDVGWYHRALQPPTPPTHAPLAFSPALLDP